MVDSMITIKESWKDLSKKENMENIIKEFTHHLKTPYFTSSFQRNRRNIPLVFTSKDEKYLQLGRGRGVFQAGLTLYCQSIDRLGIFNMKSFQKERIKPSINHWFTLGLLIRHSILNNYVFFIQQPLCFFKILVEGPHHFNICDLGNFIMVLYNNFNNH